MIVAAQSKSVTTSRAGAPAIQATPRPVPQPVAASEKQLEAAGQLEKLFYTFLVKEMRKSIGDGLFGQTPGAGIYEGLFDQSMADAVTAGGGTALREAILAGFPHGLEYDESSDATTKEGAKNVAPLDSSRAAIQDTSIRRLAAENGASLALEESLRLQGVSHL